MKFIKTDNFEILREELENLPAKSRQRQGRKPDKTRVVTSLGLTGATWEIVDFLQKKWGLSMAATINKIIQKYES